MTNSRRSSHKNIRGAGEEELKELEEQEEQRDEEHWRSTGGALEEQELDRSGRSSTMSGRSSTRSSRRPS